jgi:hypothetical protein
MKPCKIEAASRTWGDIKQGIGFTIALICVLSLLIAGVVGLALLGGWLIEVMNFTVPHGTITITQDNIWWFVGIVIAFWVIVTISVKYMENLKNCKRERVGWRKE